MAEDIKYCQSQGKAVIISMGGASGAYGFYSNSDAAAYADTVWNMFFKGTARQRPFDDAVLDGIDLDIEGGSGTGYPAFIDRLRSHYASDATKRYYIAAAPQCPFPDAYLSSTLDSAWFDMVYVQFYNNYCGLNAYPTWFNFEVWDNWAKTSSINKDVKVFIGVPGSPSAASSGYVDGSTLSTIYNAVREKYSSLGGIMTWDVSQARTSGLASSIRLMMDAGGSCSRNPPYETTTTLASSTSHQDDSATLSTRTVTQTRTHTQTLTSLLTITPGNLSVATATYPYTMYVTEYVTITKSCSDPSTNGNHETTQADSVTSAFEESNTTVPGCPVDGAPCVEGTQGCNESGYAFCFNGKWSTYSCYRGTSCYIWGNAAICDWDRQYPKGECVTKGISRDMSESDMRDGIQRTYDSTRPTAVYTTRGISSRIEIVPLSASNGQFKALVKIQTLREPISNNWALELQMPTGQSIERTSVGHLTARYPTVSITSVDSDDSSPKMALSIEISGRYSGTYRIPNVALAKIDKY
ncbi:Chitinase 2 [Coemansia sp. RSA 2399]|nr:Chitinase 2 [Coemansia sp. RSA 2399]